jgi:hypothetical protein
MLKKYYLTGLFLLQPVFGGLYAQQTQPSKVDFSYAFGAPHRLTLSRPSASEKALFTVRPERIDLQWTWSNLKDKFPLSWTVMPIDVKLVFSISVDGQKLPFSEWERACSGAPAPIVRGLSGDVECVVSAIATQDGYVMKIAAANTGAQAHSVCATLRHTNGWVISNKGWIDGRNSDVLLTMNDGRADRMIAVGKGADSYPVRRDGSLTGNGVPMAAANYEEDTSNSLKSLLSVLDLKAGEKKSAYIFLPCESYFEHVDNIRSLDLEALMTAAKREWDDYLAQGTKFIVPDAGALHCYRSCLADLFVMRETLADGYTAVSCGTDFYRSTNSCEPTIAAIAFDQLGFRRESESDMRVFFDGQDENGCWVSSKGWEHEAWGLVYYKANLAMEHYKLTRDKAFLEQLYTRMKRSSLFQRSARKESMHDAGSPFYGLMPRGMGDGGLRNGSDYYGVFYPSNIMSVAADGLTLEAAEILGKTDDIPLLTEIYNTAKTDLLRSIRANVVQEADYEYIPGIAGASNSSLYGSLYACYPAHLLEADDPLVRGIVRMFESKKVSEGGLPVGTGWMKDGLWVAMALDNVAAGYLRMGEYDMAAKYFYPTLNHASPFVTWCEERGVEKGSTATNGDLQHLWTPVALCRFMRDMMVFEQYKAGKSFLHLASAVDRSWLGGGGEVGVENASTHFGTVSYSMKYDAARQTVSGYIEIADDGKYPRPDELTLNVRLPDGRKVASVKSNVKGTVAAKGEAIRWTSVKSRIEFTAKIK